MGNEIIKGPELANACRDGRLDDVKRLIGKGFPLNWDYDDGLGLKCSPLWYACRGDHLEVVRFLLDNGADPNYGEDPPLCLVCYDSMPNCLDIAQLLLDRGADVNIRHPDKNMTPLISSCVYQDPSITLLELLIEKGARVNAVEKYGNNALYYAVYRSRCEASFLLLENGSKVEGFEQKLMWLIVDKNQSDAPRMIGLLRIAWERGVREIEDKDTRDWIQLPPWSPSNHWVYHPSFKHNIKTFLLVWNRMRIKYYGLPRELALFIIQYMSIHETKTVYHRHIEKKG